MDIQHKLDAVAALTLGKDMLLGQKVFVFPGVPGIVLGGWEGIGNTFDR